MDLIYPFVFSTFVVVVSFSLAFVVYISKPAGARKLPPGRKGWPVFGENLEFLVNGWNGHPEKFIIDRMAKFSPQVFRTSLMLEDVVVFCGSAGNKFLFSNENKLVRSWWPASVEKVIPITSMNKNNIIKRNMISKYFKSEAIRQFIPIMDMVAQKHFETEWKGTDQVVTQNLTRKYTFLVACKTFMSIDKPEHVKYLIGTFVTLAKGIFTIPIDLPGTPLRKAINASKFMRKELIAMIQQRKIDLANGKASPSQDILSQMICDDDGKSIEEYDIADVIIGLLTAGDNASTTCAFIVKYLAELPDIYQGVYKEQMEIARSKAPGELLNKRDLSKMKYSWNVACEVLRLAPPAQGTFREAITDFVYNGYSIPKGWKLYWSVNSTHSNPEFFHEPQKLDPSRFDGQGPTPYTFVPFGGGPHMCPGKEYARLEILVFMHHLVRNFKWKKVIPNERIVVNPVPIFAKGLPIRLYPHEVWN